MTDLNEVAGRESLEAYREALRWIALGRTGSYGSAEDFAKAVLASEVRPEFRDYGYGYGTA